MTDSNGVVPETQAVPDPTTSNESVPAPSSTDSSVSTSADANVSAESSTDAKLDALIALLTAQVQNQATVSGNGQVATSPLTVTAQPVVPPADPTVATSDPSTPTSPQPTTPITPVAPTQNQPSPTPVAVSGGDSEPDPDQPDTVPPVTLSDGTQLWYDVKEDGKALIRAVETSLSEFVVEYEDKAEAYAEHKLVSRLATLFRL